MLVNRHGFRMFGDYDLSSVLDGYIQKLQKDVESSQSILEEKDEEIINVKIREYHINPIIIYEDKITVSQKEVEIQGSYFPSGFFIDKSKNYTKPVITFHVPFDGDVDLLRCRPSHFLLWSDEIATEGKEIVFEIINFDNNVENLQKSRNEFLRKLKEQVSNINIDVGNHNLRLENIVKESITRAREKFKTQNEVLSKLGNPMKK